MKTAIFFILLIGACQWAWAQGSFAPWDADVAVGDRLIVDADGACPAAGYAACAGRSGGAAGGIYDSFGGGALLMIRVFQIWISPLDGPSCRFRPTCSAYGAVAVRKHGALLGGFLAGDRILRCNPFTRPGEDPVPDALFER